MTLAGMNMRNEEQEGDRNVAMSARKEKQLIVFMAQIHVQSGRRTQDGFEVAQVRCSLRLRHFCRLLTYALWKQMPGLWSGLMRPICAVVKRNVAGTRRYLHWIFTVFTLKHVERSQQGLHPKTGPFTTMSCCCNRPVFLAAAFLTSGP